MRVLCDAGNCASRRKFQYKRPRSISPNAVLRVRNRGAVSASFKSFTTKGKMLRVGRRDFISEAAETVIVEWSPSDSGGIAAVRVLLRMFGIKGCGESPGKLNARMSVHHGQRSSDRLRARSTTRELRVASVQRPLSALVFLPAGFFMTGTSAKVPTGTVIKSFVDEDVPLTCRLLAAPPLAVQTSIRPLLSLRPRSWALTSGAAFRFEARRH